MAKLTYGAITNKAYSHNISEIRHWLQRIASFVAKSPSATTEVNASLQPLVNVTGFVQSQPSNKLLVTSGVEFLAPAISGVYVNGYTLTIVGGVVTASVAS